MSRPNARGPVWTAQDAEFAAELAGFNLATRHAPALVVGALDEADIVTAVRYAREHALPIWVQGAGHGGYEPMRGGVAITTKRIAHVRIVGDVAHVGAGVRWEAVVAAAADVGLAPISGSSPTVGVAGFLFGGGLGPLARSHGYGSDYLVGARVVTGTGEVVDTDEHPELLWALRGGKYALGIVSELRVRLVPLTTMYAGSIAFADAPAALRGWIAWTHAADRRVTTSIVLGRAPDLPTVPEVLRGRYALTLRFAFPGSADEGERLVAPLRALAPILVDSVHAMPPRDVASICNDPTEPMPAWTSANMLAHADVELAEILLAHLGEEVETPFVGFEMRHLGNATVRDVPEGSAVGGRAALYTYGLVGIDESAFARMPAAAERLYAASARYLAPECNINFAAPPHDEATFARAWSPSVRARLAEVRRRYDPEQLMR